MARDRIIDVPAGLEEGAVVADLSRADIARRVMDEGRLVVLKGVFSDASVSGLRTAVADWGRQVAAADTDDFRGNYHRRRAMVSRLQQAPHVFHDYNFHEFAALPPTLSGQLSGLFEPLRGLYNDLTGNDVRLELPANGPYVHPQLIHYPSGGGFFGRHWHKLHPQALGFIVSLSRRGRDYRNGGTCFEIDGEIIDMETRHEIGDICIWRYDHPHWVTQSDLQDKFDWASDAGRWVATFAYFDPLAPAA